MVPETAQHGHGAVGFRPPDHRGGDGDAECLLGRQTLGSRQQLQHQWTGCRQAARCFGRTRRNQLGGLFAHLRAHGRVQCRGVFQTGQGQQRDPGGAEGEQLPQHPDAFAGPGVRHGHADDVLPAAVVRMADEDVQVAFLHGVPGRQVVLERAVDEVHDVLGRPAQHSAAQQQGLQHRLGVVPSHGRCERGQRPLHDPLGRLQGHLGAVAQHHRVGDALEQLQLGLLVHVRALDGPHAPLPVPAGEQHGEGGVVQLLASGGQVAAALAVEGADQSAHQGVGDEAGQVTFGAQGVEQPSLVLRGARGLVPAVDEGGDLRPVHGSEGEFPEPFPGQPVGAYGGGAGGQQPAVVGVGVDEGAQPLTGGVAVGRRNLVEPVDEDQGTPCRQYAFRPALRRRQRAAGCAEKACGRRQLTRPDQRTQGEDVRNAGAFPGRRHRQPLDERRLAGPGVAAQQHPRFAVQRFVGGQPSGTGRGVLVGPGVPVGFSVGGRLQRQVGDLQRPPVRRVAQVDAVDGEVVVAVGDVRPVPAFERRVAGVRAGDAGDQLVDLRDQLGLAAGLGHQRAGDERGAPGEELQDVQAGPLGRGVEEVARVGGQTGARPGAGRLPPQPGGQFAVAEAHRLDVVHVQVAEGEQPRGEGVGDGRLLVAREGRLAPGVQRGPDQVPGELAHLRRTEAALLAPEGHQAGEADGPVDQSGARPVRHEQLLHQRGDRAGRQLPAEYRRFHAPPPWSVVVPGAYPASGHRRHDNWPS